MRLFQDDVIFLQRLLKASGFYSGRIDGAWGPLTDAAVLAFDEQSAELAETYGRFDARTEANIATLHVAAQAAARIFMTRLADAGTHARIISGTRTYAEQNALFRRGRWGNPGPRVTNARGGQSTHNFAIAWDIGVFENGRYVRAARPYEEAARLASSDELVWGGSWTGFRDRPHYHLATEFDPRQLRERFERGLPYLG